LKQAISLFLPAVKNTAESSSNREIVFSRVLHAPRELVWQAWTDPKHVSNWWGPRGFTTTTKQMDFRVGGQWEHVMHGPDGANYPNKSTFKEIVPLERITYLHGGGREDGPGASFTATWTFEAIDGNKTRLTGRMVFPSAEARDFVVKEFGAIEGGKQTLERASEYVAGLQNKPFVISREFNASRELMWKVWSEREHFARWFGPKGIKVTMAKFDLRPGGMNHYSRREGDLGQGRLPGGGALGKTGLDQLVFGQGRGPHPASSRQGSLAAADADGGYVRRKRRPDDGHRQLAALRVGRRRAPGLR
jgi:uncharacterized protein YndB with AHSA1/START domain